MSLAEWLAAHPYKGPFKPGARYHLRDGDILEVWLEDERAYSEPIGDGAVHVHRAMSDGRVVGISVWGVSQVMHV